MSYYLPIPLKSAICSSANRHTRLSGNGQWPPTASLQRLESLSINGTPSATGTRPAVFVEYPFAFQTAFHAIIEVAIRSPATYERYKHNFGVQNLIFPIPFGLRYY